MLRLYTKRQVILSILCPSLEYGSEVWRCTTSQSKALDAVLLAVCKKFYVAPQRFVAKLYGVIYVLSL